jgi:hypothetical protein
MERVAGATIADARSNLDPRTVWRGTMIARDTLATSAHRTVTDVTEMASAQ